VDLLAPIQQMVLKIASVMGRSFTASVIQAVFPEDILESQQVEVIAELASLVKSGILIENAKEHKYASYIPVFTFLLFRLLLFICITVYERIFLCCLL
jgi:predicted ATPase